MNDITDNNAPDDLGVSAHVADALRAALRSEPIVPIDPAVRDAEISAAIDRAAAELPLDGDGDLDGPNDPDDADGPDDPGAHHDLSWPAHPIDHDAGIDDVGDDAGHWHGFGHDADHPDDGIDPSSL